MTDGKGIVYSIHKAEAEAEASEEAKLRFGKSEVNFVDTVLPIRRQYTRKIVNQMKKKILKSIRGAPPPPFLGEGVENSLR